MSGKKALFGLALVLIGLLLLGKSLDLFFFSFRDFTSFFLPLLLIILGFWLIIRKKRRESADHEYRATYYARAPQRPVGGDLNIMNIDLPPDLLPSTPQFLYLWAPGW